MDKEEDTDRQVYFAYNVHLLAIYMESYLRESMDAISTINLKK